MILHYVLFDGSSAYIGDASDINEDTEIVFQSTNLDVCESRCDKFNESL
jgi:hypothetical protein